MKPLTREWREKAEGDLGTAERESVGPNPDAVAFHAQQCAEKYIKAVLCERDIVFARTHDLVNLARLVSPPSDALLALSPRLKALTTSAVEVRYPGSVTTSDEAKESLATARDVRQICRNLIGQTSTE